MPSYLPLPPSKRGSAAAVTLALWAAAAPLAAGASPRAGASDPDRAAITQVLDRYTRAVSTGDEALFATLLLDERVPFFSAGDAPNQRSDLTSDQTRRYDDFRTAIFRSGRHFRQRFDQVAIEHRGSLAQVSLHFVTTEQGQGGGEGWKILALLKVGDHWRIASEYYTVAALRTPASGAPR